LDYANTKKQLFQWVVRNKDGLWIGVLNKDDEFWKEWLEELAFKTTLSYGIFSMASFKAENIKESLNWTYFELKYLNKNYPVNLKLPGAFNVYNALAAIAMGFALKVPLEKAIKSLEELEPVKWRVNQIFDEKNQVTYIIDYAHTPNALKSVLEFLQKVKKDGRIITVFGAPWMRDQDKRPKMWEIADKLSDIVILTDDDPDKEDRFKIIDQVKQGIKRQIWDNFWIIPERSVAVKLAHDIAQPNDIVLIAGKWHETVQLTNHWKIHYSDIETVKELLGL
jgi:UDP-N-acetylmuramoyl-L-alanyl-D-glutamate--2,6-diaminopimelate ligase